jgi:hypothetical protein
MNMNAMLIRSTVLMVVALVLAFTATRHAPAQAQSTPTIQATAKAADAHPIVELPTISVRPSAADLMAAAEDDNSSDPASSGTLIDATATDTLYDTFGPNVPSLRMDIPYYSFGKALRRGVKE